MKRLIATSLAALMGVILHSATPTAPRTGEYVKFEIKNAGVTVEGSFTEFSAEANYDASAPTQSTFSGTIKVASIETGIGMRDDHLKEEEYFHASRFPDITFRSTSVREKGGGVMEVTGKLSMKGTERTVKFDVKPVTVDGVLYLEGTLYIDRLDYGVGESSWIMSDDVKCIIRAMANA